MKETKLLIIPSPLGENDLISEIYSELARKYMIENFFIETPKVGRTIVKKLLKERSIQELDMYILDKNSTEDDIDNFIRTIKYTTSAIISDNGLPGISDPGRELIRAAHKMNYDIIPVAATSSITTALSCSGLNGEQFHYHGYLPRDKSLRIHSIKNLEKESFETGASQVFIETPYRNIHLWTDLINNCDERTELSVSIDLFGDRSNIKTARITDWKKMRWPDMRDMKVVFILNSHPDIRKAENKKKRNGIDRS